MKKVSIIIPVYNSEKYISRCLDSVLSQSYSNIEIIVINDGSKDNSLKIIKKYKDKRIKVIDKKNEGVAKTRNLGIKEASGDYIMFIDNDDYIDKDYVYNYINQIDDNDIIIGGYQRINKNKKVLFKYTLIDTYWSRFIVMAPWAKLYKKSFLVDNDIEFFQYGIGEDVYFNLKALSFNPKVKIIKDDSYIWFYNEESVSNTNQKGLKKKIDIEVLLNELLHFIDINDKYIKYYINRYVIWYLLFSGRNGNSKDFINEYNKMENWLRKNKLNDNWILSFKDIKGETLKNKMIVRFFYTIKKIHLIKMFSRVYCKGE